jgi:hypothetical protein
MLTVSETTSVSDETTGSWKAGVLGGIGGGIVMAGLILAMNTPTLAVAIPSLYALAPPPNPAVGLFVHISHGAILGVIFAGILGALDVDSLSRTVGAGALWGVLTWGVLAALVMPIWLGAVGSPASPPLPNFAPPSLLWHVVYGVVLGGVYTALVDQL